MRVTLVIGPGKGPFLIFLQTTVVSPSAGSGLGTLRVIDYLIQAVILLTAVVPLSLKAMGKFVISVTGNERDHCLHFHPLLQLREMDGQRILRRGRIESVRQPGAKDV